MFRNAMREELQFLVKRIKNSFQDLVESSGFDLEWLGKLADGFEVLEKFSSFLGKRGWGIPGYSVDARVYTGALFDNERDFQKAEIVVSDYYENTAESMAMLAANQPILEPWKNMILAAAAAHKRQEYGIAVPAWLICIEAIVRILRERSTDPRAGSHKAFTARSANKYRGSFNALFVTKSGNSLRSILADTLSAMGQDEKRATDFEPAVNRNLVMHGIRAVTSRDDSLRVLSILSALIDEAISDEEEAVRAAQFFMLSPN